eukprot:m.456869 g.456869  ORF g.456869 m.456869 type:complete len:347 (-) comp20327_c2_seq1:94-1134(-)
MSNPKQASWASLPDPLLQHCLSFLLIEPNGVVRSADLVNVCRVCSSWDQAAGRLLAAQARTICIRPLVDFDLDPVASHPRIARAIASLLPLGLGSCVPPPAQDSFGAALENFFAAMLRKQERYEGVRQVHFGNYELTDASLALIPRLFPNLRTLVIDSYLVTTDGIRAFCDARPAQLQAVALNQLKQVHPTPAVDSLLALPTVQTVFWIQQRIHAESFTPRAYNGRAQHCGACGGFFLPGSGDTACLMHPGVYSGYGSSCSSYACCGSAEPGYIYTPGCTFRPHSTETGRRGRLAWEFRGPVMEFFFEPFRRHLFPRDFGWLRCTRETRHEARSRIPPALAELPPK